MIRVDALCFFYRSNRKILDAITFEAEAAHCVAVLGNNGAGKSTLLKCLNRILRPQGGVVRVNGKEIARMSREDVAQHIAYVAQHGETGRFTVFDAVLLGRKPYIKLNPREEDYEITGSIIRQMHLEDMTLRYIDELSGGELQKVMIARALVQQPRVLLLDEPTSSLDLKNQHEILELIRRIAGEKGICVILAIHDLNLALRYCNRFLFLKDKRIFAYGGDEVMNGENIRKIYDIPVLLHEINNIKVIIPNPA
jgi:iron complex transport system ATP-binding protein